MASVIDAEIVVIEQNDDVPINLHHKVQNNTRLIPMPPLPQD